MNTLNILKHIIIFFILFSMYFFPSKFIIETQNYRMLTYVSIVFAISMTILYYILYDQGQEGYSVTEDSSSKIDRGSYATMSSYDDTPMLDLSDITCSDNCRCPKGFNGQKKVRFRYSSYVPPDESKCSKSCPTPCAC